MTDAIVVAAHPDDEVLGASTVLTSRTCTVAFATDGVPPLHPVLPVLASPTRPIRAWETPKQEGGRVGEARAAHHALGARVDGYVRLGFGDQRVTDQVVECAHALADVVAARDGADVFVPAYQRGHPDHDAVFVAAQLARAELLHQQDQVGGRARRWFAYALYGLDREGHQRFGWLDPDYFTHATSDGGSPAELERKAAALRVFESQLPDESVLAGWLADPVPESFATVPNIATPLPELRCFYEEVFEFSQFGIDPVATDSTLRARLRGLSPRG